MKTTDFTDHPRVREWIAELKAQREAYPAQFVFSDVVDGEGHQYIDLVQEGGGTLGIALVGYTYVLEEMGIRFVSLAGTSAGAINTLLLAALGRPAEPKSPLLIEQLANKNFYDFVDGGYAARRLIRAVTEHSGLISLAYRVLWVLGDLRKRMGLNPGDQFLFWLIDLLESHDITTMRELEQRMNDFPADIHFRPEIEDPNRFIRASLGIIAADLTTETKVVFPGMAHLYYPRPEEVNPAGFVRASMSIPLFFEPFVISGLPRGMEAQWEKLAFYQGEIPNRAILVDGGILSNFPIDVFHITDKVPSRPTFGVKLGLERNEPQVVRDYKQLVYGCFNAACRMRDLEFICKHPDYQHLLSMVDVGEHDWLNFEVPDELKIDLFLRGAEAAFRFLQTFDWEFYKKIRRDLLIARQIRERHAEPVV